MTDTRLYTADQVRELDRVAIEDHGVPGIHLMKRAGRAVLDTVLECWPEPSPLIVMCGSGNNAGDGYIVAALAKEKNIPVEVFAVADPGKLRGDAATAHDYACDAGVEVQLADLRLLSAGPGAVIVDALLGTGLSGDVRPEYSELIEQVNILSAPVVAVDVPSGLCATTGRALGSTVCADLTVTFIGRKCGLFTADGPLYAGEIFFDDLDVSGLVDNVFPAGESIGLGSLEELLWELEPRSPLAHKSNCGHLLVIGGNTGYGGAPLMSAEAALRMGAGLVTLATRPEHVPAAISRCPEVMAHPVSVHHDLLPLLDKASHIVLGPGLGQDGWAEQMFYHTLIHAAEQGKPVVLDADGLNLLAGNEGRTKLVDELPDDVILTPHPGEAARLLGVTASEVQQDRLAALRQLQSVFHAAVVLKGAGTLTGTEAGVSLCPYGNPGMASGGMGDVLSGILGGLWAQGLEASLVAELGTCLHSYAADILASEYGERGLLATDLIAVARQLLNDPMAIE
jgi:NAD(P)H-hydrate epimerase